MVANGTGAKEPEPLHKATDNDKLAMFHSYEAFLFDLDGTIWRGDHLIPGAKELVETLLSYGKKVFYVTNNASKSRAANVAKLKASGIHVGQDDVYNSAAAAAAYLQEKNFKKKAYVVGEEGLIDELTGHGIRVLGGPEHKDRQVDWSSAEPAVVVDPEVGAVVVGIDRNINYYKLQYATMCLMNKDCHFIACNTDSRGHFSHLHEWAGAGTMVGALKGSSEREPVVVGKPSAYILDRICKRQNLKRDQCLVIGDRLDTDILWGNELGAGTCCVLSGVTTEAQLLDPGNKIKPKFYMDSVGDFMSVQDQLPLSCSIQ